MREHTEEVAEIASADPLPYKAQKWQSGNVHWCIGSSNPACTCAQHLQYIALVGCCFAVESKLLLQQQLLLPFLLLFQTLEQFKQQPAGVL